MKRQTTDYQYIFASHVTEDKQPNLKDVIEINDRKTKYSL